MSRSPRLAGTRSPEAIVDGSRHGSAVSLPDSKARTIGAQPAACTTTIRGLAAPIQPSVSISSNAFHMPMSPVPPPVG